jgi:hypothetical protein
MHVRDAVEADAERLAELTGAPTDVMRNLVHDRTVRVAVRSAADEEGQTSDGTGTDEARAGAANRENGTGVNGDPSTDDIVGFVSFDAKRETVHITQMEGTRAATRRLLEEPRRFAANEGMSVELLVADGDEEHRAVAEEVGFGEAGPGPRFGGTATVRYRLDP